MPFALLFLALNVYFLGDLPIVNVDEPWYGEPAWAFSRTGHFFPMMFRGMHFNLAGEYRWSIYQLLLAPVFKTFGFGAYQARFVSFLAGLLALSVLFFLGKRLFNARVGLLACVLFAFSPIYEVARIARPDMLLTAFTLLALYLCHLSLGADRPTLYGLTGLATVFTVDTHPNGVMVVSTVGLLLLTQTKTWRTRARAIGFFLSGIFAGGLYWLAAHGPVLTEYSFEGSIFPPPDYWRFCLLKLRSYSTMFYGGSFQYLTVESVLMGASLVGLAIRRRRADVFLLTSIAVFPAFYVFVFSNPNVLYLVYLFPLLFLALAAFVDDRLQGSTLTAIRHGIIGKREIVGGAMLTIVVALAVAKGVVDVFHAWQHQGAYTRYIAKLKAYVPDDAVVMGQPTWFYGFQRQPYYADRYFAWIAKSLHKEVRDHLGRTFETAMAMAGVEYLIFDSQLSRRMLEHRNAIQSLPADEVALFLRDRCVEVGSVQEEEYGFLDEPGVTRIYRVHHDRASANQN